MKTALPQRRAIESRLIMDQWNSDAYRVRRIQYRDGRFQCRWGRLQLFSALFSPL